MNGLPEPDVRRTVQITNQRGLHARASARFVQLAETFNASIEVERDGMTVPAVSIMGLMMLAAGPGSEIEIRASGAEAEAAVNALVALVEDRFGEE
jgi:phosphocarrier protein HPr